MSTRTLPILIALAILLCLAGCKSPKETATQPDAPKTETTQETAKEKDAPTADSGKEAPAADSGKVTSPQESNPSSFKTLQEADNAVQDFWKGIKEIAEKTGSDCHAAGQAIEKYYQDNGDKLEKAMQFASNEAANDDDGEKAGEVFSFFRTIEMSLSDLGLFGAEKLDPCVETEQIKAVWDKIRKLLEKYEPEDVANEGISDDEGME